MVFFCGFAFGLFFVGFLFFEGEIVNDDAGNDIERET